MTEHVAPEHKGQAGALSPHRPHTGPVAIVMERTPALAEAVNRKLPSMTATYQIFTTSTLEATLERIRRCPPQLLLLDQRGARDDLLPAASLAGAQRPHCQVGLLVAGSNAPEYACARRAGVTTVLSRTMPRAYLEHLVWVLAVRGLGSSCACLDRLTPEDLAALTLTPREAEIWRLLALGGTVRLIAAELGLSANTVDVHKTHLMAKLAVHDRADLVRLAVKLHVVSTDEHWR